MNKNKPSHNKLIDSNAIGLGESTEDMALNINLIRARESRRPRRGNIDWFSL